MKKFCFHDKESGVSSIPQPIATTLLNKSSLILEQKLEATISNFKGLEINIFEATRKRKESLNNMCSASMTIKPTSIESKRAFSATGLFMGKFLSRFSDKSIDCLYFLKYFLTQII